MPWFSVEEAGLTPEAMSRLIADALLDLEEQAKSKMGRDRLALSSDPSSVPNIEAPGNEARTSDTRRGNSTLTEIANVEGIRGGTMMH